MPKCHKHGKYFSVTIVLLCISITVLGVYNINRLQVAQVSNEEVSERYGEVERENDQNPEYAKYYESIVCNSSLLLPRFNTVLQTHSSLSSFSCNCPFKEVPSRAPPSLKS